MVIQVNKKQRMPKAIQLSKVQQVTKKATKEIFREHTEIVTVDPKVNIININFYYIFCLFISFYIRLWNLLILFLGKFLEK